MEIKGKFLELLEAKTGESQRGSWKKQEFILETDDQFPKKVCIANWNDKVDLTNITPGTPITAHINVESREYNGNWYTDVKVWKLETEASATPPPPSEMPGLNDPESSTPFNLEPGEPDEDLPF